VVSNYWDRDLQMSVKYINAQRDATENSRRRRLERKGVVGKRERKESYLESMAMEVTAKNRLIIQHYYM
jgi:hypothetical protein